MNISDSARLTYDFMTAKDAQLLFELDQDSEVMRYINGGEQTSMQEIREIFIPRLESYADLSKGWGMWKVSIKPDNDTAGHLSSSEQFLGWILVRPLDFFSESPQWNNLELGWRFKQSAWGKGIATEAAQAVMEAVTGIEHVHYISAIALEENISSIKIMKKLGMRFLKKAMHYDPLGDSELVYYQKEIKPMPQIR
ncbi:GNAT family N-acetyltransferase [Shewanella nanhaiensis]|uniref:GNAT family N-acetyltransferase n=1 Tax=Shewanella nanhaiensis TaxID=2864872 RepID=A0ABS7EAC5_9GAMM|nr:GNAT family N-acetyltransferase [Shewanella nanhaiensis]MBW8186622.1 GNAT family N-acetyltransferase [Shewanella nanhaiensis]